MLDELQASPKSETTDSTSTSTSSSSDSSGLGVMGGRSFGDYDLADMTTATPTGAYPPYNYLDNENSSAGGSDNSGSSGSGSSGDRNLNLDVDSSSGGGSGLKASDFVFPSDLVNTPIAGATPSTSTSDINSAGAGSSGTSSGSNPPNTAGMTKFQLQMSGQWNQQVGNGLHI